MRRARRAFSLAELLMVLAIMAITSSMILPLVGDNEASQLRAAAELLAADIEDVQGRSLAEPGSPTCLQVASDGSGWHIALVSDPGQPISDFEGRPLSRRFGRDGLAGCSEVVLSANDLPSAGLQFDDQGAPASVPGRIDFLLNTLEGESSLRVAVSASTGRVTIERN